MSWTCPECGYSNSDDLIKCICGYMDVEEDEPVSSTSLNNTDPLKTLKRCVSCDKEVPLKDKFCSFCGKPTVALSEEEKQKIRRASGWILAISILFVIGGTCLGFIEKSIAEKAQNNLAPYEEFHVWDTPINGESYTVGELRTQIDQEVILVFITNYFLAAVMFGLYLWARRSPFPAMVTALCVYLAVIVLNGIVDPKTLFKGIIIKAIFLSAIIAGIKASLVSRGISQTHLKK
jgi:predicted nucleic acid-binding Zn ribbon protein